MIWPFSREGEKLYLGLNVRIISDGGIALVWLGLKKTYYLRARGIGNNIKPRICWSINVR